MPSFQGHAVIVMMHCIADWHRKETSGAGGDTGLQFEALSLECDRALCDSISDR